jgi:predicted nucleic acid-binding protein
VPANAHSACVLDTDVVIAALDRRDSHHRRAARSLETMIEQQTTLLLSLINYAETLVRPAEDEQTLRIAIDAIASFGVKLVAPTPAIARDAARYRTLNVSLADGFAIATAQAHQAALATFDRRVRRALSIAGLELTQALT